MLGRVFGAGISTVFAMSILAGAALAQDMPGAGKTVNPARASWDTFWWGGTILQVGLEKLGYKVKAPKTLRNAARYTAVSQGDLDFETDTVMPNATPFMKKIEGKVEMIGPIMNPGSVQGYLIDKATAEKHGITYLTDFLDPKIAKIFDSDGDGKANLLGGSVGTNSELVINHHIKKLGLAKTFEAVVGEYNVMVADAVARYKDGKPVLIYAWRPNAATLQMVPGKDLVWLQMKKTDLPGGQAGIDTVLRGVEGCTGNADPCNTGWPATQYFITANKKWAAENPAAIKLFGSVKIALDDRADQNMKMINGEDSEADLRRHAEEWIARNKAQFEGWLSEARKAAK